MDAIQTAEPEVRNALNFETIWAILKEVAESQKETSRKMEETDRKMKETDRLQKENAQYMKEVGKRLGDFTNSFGDIVEYMVAPKLQDKFREFGMDFQITSKDIKYHDHKNDIQFQIDIFLQNGDFAMLVEIKATLTISDINKHIERLQKMRKYADLHNDKRKFLGAVAGIAISDDVKEYALEQGFYLVEPTGEDFHITPPHDKPKEW